MQIESFEQQAIQQIVPSYLYEQYSDDVSLQAFVDAYNSLAQGFLDWFNGTPLGLYASPNVVGGLLDWIGAGVYGITRPVISTLQTSVVGSLNSVAINLMSINAYQQIQSGTAQLTDDDVYKRTMTWVLYKGDGLQMSIPWLRRRVARFIYGANGSDVSADDFLNISIKQQELPATGSIPTQPINTSPINTRDSHIQKAKSTLVISIPDSNIAQQFANLLRQGILPIPFQMKILVHLT